MMSITTFYFVTSMIIVVQSQQWTGTFTADSTCSRTICCCLDGQIVVTHPSAGILAITSGLSGQCGGLPTLSTTVSYPNGYTGYLTVGNQTLTFALSNDSRIISAVNPTNSACNGNAYRNAAIKQFGNIMAIVALIFIGLTKLVY